MVPVAHVALEVEPVVGEDGRQFQGEQAGKTEPEGQPGEMARGVPGPCSADRVGSPRHRVELQPEAGQPCRETPAHALDGRQCTVAERQALAPRLLDPLGATFRACGLDRAEDGAAHRLDAAKAQGCAAKGVQSRRAIDPAIDPRWRVHRRQQMGGLADQELVPAFAVLAVGERETRHEDTIEKAFQAGRHRAPPGGEDEDEMVRPGDKVDGIGDAGFQRLVAGRRHQDILLETEVDEREPPQLGPGALGACRIGVGQGLTQAAPAGMSKNEEDLRWPGARLRPGRFFGGNLLKHHQPP